MKLKPLKAQDVRAQHKDRVCQPIRFKQALSHNVVWQTPWLEPGNHWERRSRQNTGLIHPGDQVTVVGAHRHTARTVMDHGQIGTLRDHRNACQ